MDFSAVITAGGRVDGEFAKVLGTPVKALGRVGGRTMLDAAIDALRGAGIARIAVLGGDEVRAACGDRVERVIAESPDGSENQRRALRAWDDAAPLLYLTSDMPFLTAAALTAFISRIPDGSLAMPLTEVDDFERRFPGAPPFGVTLGGERVVNGGAFALPPHAARRVEALALRFFHARKSVWKMAQLTGPALLVRFLFRQLHVADLERRAQHLLGVPAVGLRNAPPELAYDVDILAEYHYAAANA